MEYYTQQFQDLVSLYTKTKALILRAEQVDPDSASNIAVFKEQRDAADHLMRVLGALFLDPPDGVTKAEYISTHFDKARSHLFRASFDALDGIGLSTKLLLREALVGVSNEAISAVFPAYWEKIVEFDQLDEQVTAHRNGKDIGSNTMKHLESYSVVVDHLHSISQEIRQHVRHFREWDTRNKEKTKRDFRLDIKKEALKFLLFAFIGGLIYKGAEVTLFKSEAASKPQTQRPSAATNTQLPKSSSPGTNGSTALPKAP